MKKTTENDLELIAYAKSIGVSPEQVERIEPGKGDFCDLCPEIERHCDKCFVVTY
jgi:hypothetical protein